MMECKREAHNNSSLVPFTFYPSGRLSTGWKAPEPHVRERVIRIPVAAFFLALGLALSPAEVKAGWVVEDGKIIDGKVTDTGPPGTVVGIRWTGVHTRADGTSERVELRPPEGQPADQTIGASRSVEWLVPSGKTATFLGVGRVVTDANQSTLLPNSARAVLEMAAFVPSGGDFLMFPLISYVQSNLGVGVELSIPDLFADTDGNGVLGVSDTLYSTVNLTEFLPASVNFNFGDTYSIVNGTSLLLPGMLFGVQPIVPNASSPTGYDNPAPWTGTAVALASHGISAVPEPGTVLLFGISFIALFGC